MQRLDSLYIRGFRAGIRAVLDFVDNIDKSKNKSAKVVSKNTVQLVKLLHENAVELAEGERPELWITQEGKLFLKNGEKSQNEI
jgi:hypothetical protein